MANINQNTQFAIKFPFIYQVQITLAANGNGQESLTLGNDSYFSLCGFGAFSNPTGVTPQTLTNQNSFSVAITDNSTGRQLSNARIPQAIITNVNYSQYLNFTGCVIYPPLNVFFCDFQNLVGDVNIIQLCFVGYKLINPIN
jgi:hypothetical protein